MKPIYNDKIDKFLTEFGLINKDRINLGVWSWEAGGCRFFQGSRECVEIRGGCNLDHKVTAEMRLNPVPPSFEMICGQMVLEGLLGWPDLVEDVGAWVLNVSVT
jgi:hypothetical protein